MDWVTIVSKSLSLAQTDLSFEAQTLPKKHAAAQVSVSSNWFAMGSPTNCPRNEERLKSLSGPTDLQCRAQSLPQKKEQRRVSVSSKWSAKVKPKHRPRNKRTPYSRSSPTDLHSEAQLLPKKQTAAQVSVLSNWSAMWSPITAQETNSGFSLLGCLFVRTVK